MPIYEYHCGNCGADLEIFQHMADPTLRLCPQCQAEALEKVFSPVGIVFKGSGFYATDHKGSKSTLASGAAPRGETAGETKTEAAKTEPAAAGSSGTTASSPASSSGDTAKPAAGAGDK